MSFGPDLWEQGYIIIMILVKCLSMLFDIYSFLPFSLCLASPVSIYRIFLICPSLTWNSRHIIVLFHTVLLFKVVFCFSCSSCVYVYWSMNSLLSNIPLGIDFLVLTGAPSYFENEILCLKKIFKISSKQV